MTLRRSKTWVGIAALVVLAVLAVAWRGWPRPPPAVVAPARPATPNPAAAHARRPLEPAAARGPARSVQQYVIADDGTVPVPARFQLPGVARVRAGSATSFQQWLALFPDTDQQAIADFHRRHFGVYAINSPQQIAWMAQNGYPMPEDVIAAQALSEDDLRALARQGNDKAAFLLRERDIAVLKNAYEAYTSAGKGTDTFWREDPRAPQMQQDLDLHSRVMHESNSPFKGYLQAQDALLEAAQPSAYPDQTAMDVAATVIGGLWWAYSLGDFRATQFIQSYVGSDPMRMAVFSGAMYVEGNAVEDSIKMSTHNCAPVGVPLDGWIPGEVSPVE
jgi:hypothetical protein